jgi:HlyD family secretion protein
MNKKIIALTLAAAGALGAAAWFQHNGREQTDTNQLVVYGNVDIRQVQLAFNASERIVRMDLREGESVTEGQLLASLDTQRFEHAVARAKARVEAQRNVVAALEAGTRPEEVRKLRADFEAARVDADNAARNFHRLKDLAAGALASQEQADNAEAAADATRARVKAAREALNLAIAGPRAEDIAAARATLESYQAELDLARQDLANARLYAPADGVIRNRILEPGDMATPQTPVYTLALTDPVWVRAYLPEPALGKIRPGQTAEITTDSFPNKRYPAWIGYISPTAEFTPKSVETSQVRTDLVYQVRVYACNPQGELRLGMPATVTIDLGGSVSPDTARSTPPCDRAQ